MTAYTVYFTTVASKAVQVEADDPDEAIERADEEISVSVCHQCAREFELGDVWEPEAVVEDQTNKVVWEERTS